VGDHEDLIAEIRALIASSSHDLELIERTLTVGYASALSMEAEQWRLQKRLGAVAATLERGDLERNAKELSELSKRVERQEATLARLRKLLVQLRAEYSGVTEAVSARPPAAPRSGF
jgi:hypothetical protein